MNENALKEVHVASLGTSSYSLRYQRKRNAKNFASLFPYR